MSFPFREDPNTATILCKHIARGEKPILYVSHDDDGMWQFLCNQEHNIEDLMLVSLKQAYELDPSIGEIKDLPLGKTLGENILKCRGEVKIEDESLGNRRKRQWKGRKE